MRTDQIHTAIALGNNRFEICHLTSKGVQRTHKPGERTEDSITRVLSLLGRGPPLPNPRAEGRREASTRSPMACAG